MVVIDLTPALCQIAIDEDIFPGLEEGQINWSVYERKLLLPCIFERI
jgi:hypothetical protein